MAEQQKKVQEQDINQLVTEWRETLAAFQGGGRVPFRITRYDVTHHNQEITHNFDTLEKRKASIAGGEHSNRICR